MKRLILSLAVGAVLTGSWYGWRTGASHKTGSFDRMAFNAALKPAGSVYSAPGATTLEDWRELMEIDPDEVRTNDAAHMARVREVARGLSLKDLLQRIEAGLDDPALAGGISNTLATLVQELVRRDAGQACDLLLRKNAWRYGGAVFEEWGRQNHRAAFAWLDAHPDHEGARYEIIRGWAENDPAAAFQVLTALSAQKDDLDSIDREGDRWTFFTPWAQKDPEAAVAAWASQPDENFCLNAHWGEALFACDPAGRDRVVAALRKVTDPSLRANALSECASFFTFAGEPEKGIVFTEDEFLPESEKLQMRQRVLEAWAHLDGPAAASWFLATGPPGQGDETIRRCLGAMNISLDDTDLSTSLAWLRSLPPDSLPAAVPQMFAETGFRYTPVAALRGWLTLQTSAGISNDSVDKLGRYLSTAPQAARLPSVLQEAGFSAELSAQILTAAGQGGERAVSGD